MARPADGLHLAGHTAYTGLDALGPEDVGV
jgi:hypothetical protein